MQLYRVDLIFHNFAQIHQSARRSLFPPMGDAESYEEENVHAVYEEIATHFSSTRYKVRPHISLPIAAFNTSQASDHNLNCQVENRDKILDHSIGHR